MPIINRFLDEKMTQEMAAGPKTELVGVTGRMQQSIEDQLAALALGVSECLQNARTIGPKNSLDDSRSCERRDAVQFVSATAELLQAIAKVRGEFRHDYRVTRAGDRPAGPKLKIGWSGDEAALLNQAEYDALNQWEQEDYARWCEGLPPRFGGWKKPVLPSGAPPTPLENRGSNADAEES